MNYELVHITRTVIHRWTFRRGRATPRQTLHCCSGGGECQVVHTLTVIMPKSPSSTAVPLRQEVSGKKEERRLLVFV